VKDGIIVGCVWLRTGEHGPGAMCSPSAGACWQEYFATESNIPIDAEQSMKSSSG
jgi:hypothetical protein